MAGTNIGAGAGGGEFTPEEKNVIRYVVAINSNKLDRNALPWKTLEREMSVYRGQSALAKSSLGAGEGEREGWERILTTFRGKPTQISTSKRLNADIVAFARGYDFEPPQGRLFQITVNPGVRYVDIDAVAVEMRRKGFAEESQAGKFQFIIDESRPHWEANSEALIAAKRKKIETTKRYAEINRKNPEKLTKEQLEKFWNDEAEQQAKTQHYAFKAPTFIRDAFFRNATREREVLLDLTGTKFMHKGEDGTLKDEEWNGQEISIEYPIWEKNKITDKFELKSTATAVVYPTILQPVSPLAGRGRTFRRKPRRRDKNGGRPTRKSKPRRHQ